MSSTTLVALLSGPDQPGLVAKVSGWIYEHGGNIIHADQHRDPEENIFFQRIEWDPMETPAGEAAQEFTEFARSLGMTARVADSSHRPRVAIMVSRFAHCFHDLILRWKAGELPAEIVAVVSNHPDLEEESQHYGLPFYHLPIDPKQKEASEDKQIEALRPHRPELVVMARYMQILSSSFLEKVGCPVINIHHSFLPAFAGGKPYHQAYRRGVKLIGATAHYATPVLDDGPIIQQDVVRVTHRHHIKELVRKGRQLEQAVLAQAVLWQLQNRILVYGNKTVVFD
ncbi:MAG: formyltetrahydrofolate deformylase [Opitutales bacterium]|nr:formyltetrahydrofolate deformylase [Opitutales bacterium]